MKKSKRLLITALLCLCLCLTLSVLLPGKASADEVISKVLTTTKYTPVALMDVALSPAGTSTSGVYIASYCWFDVNTGNIVTQFGEGTYRVEITLGTYDGFYFDEPVRAYLNNIPVDYVMSADYRTMTVYRTYAAEIWAPSVVKQPRDETVDPGGIASFSATATYTVGYQWHAYNPANKMDFLATDLPDVFAGVTLNPEGQSTLTIQNVPVEMDGWHIYCTFLGASWSKSNSNYALLKVRPSPRPRSLRPSPPRSRRPSRRPNRRRRRPPCRRPGSISTSSRRPGPLTTRCTGVNAPAASGSSRARTRWSGPPSSARAPRSRAWRAASAPSAATRRSGSWPIPG